MTLLRDIEKKGDAASADDELSERVAKLERKIDSWTAKATLQASIDQAVNEAASEGGHRVEEVVEIIEIDEEERDKVPPVAGDETLGAPSDNVGDKRKRVQGSSSAASKRPRQGVLARDRPEIWRQARGLHIGLPSSYNRVIQERDCLKAVVAVEGVLRRRQAGAALDSLRTHLITREMTTHRLKSVDRRVDEGRATRHTAKLLAKEEKIEAAAARYRMAYCGLVSLKQATAQEFRPLPRSEVRPFVVRIEDQQLGDSRVQPSWIWQSLRFLGEGEVMANFDEFAEEGTSPLGACCDRSADGSPSDQSTLVPYERDDLPMA